MHGDAEDGEFVCRAEFECEVGMSDFSLLGYFSRESKEDCVCTE